MKFGLKIVVLKFSTTVLKVAFELTAGSAKNEIANTLKQDATILPIHVWGTVSP